MSNIRKFIKEGHALYFGRVLSNDPDEDDQDGGDGDRELVPDGQPCDASQNGFESHPLLAHSQEKDGVANTSASPIVTDNSSVDPEAGPSPQHMPSHRQTATPAAAPSSAPTFKPV